MILALLFARSAVSVAIALLAGVSFVPREAANRLVPLQRRLSRQINQRRGLQ